MKKNYFLVLIAFLCAILSGFGQVSENFDGLTENSYGNYSYNGFEISNGLCNSTNSLSGNAVRLRNATTALEYVGGDGNGKDGGVGDISFWYRSWDASPTAVFDVEVSINGAAYTTVGSQISTFSTTYAQWTYSLNNTSDNIRIRISRVSGERLHIDDFEITDYAVTTDPNLAITGITNHGSSCLTNAATTIQYTITNSGILPAAGVNAVSDNPQFVVSNLSSPAIAASGTSTFDVTFTPTTAGAQTATITVSSTTPTSNSPTIDLIGTGSTSPTITTQPTAQNEVIPDTATFTVTATNAVSYQWQVSTNGGGTWNNVTGGTGATTNSYTTGATSAPMNNNQYRCVVTNACGTVNSNAATLTLTNTPTSNVTGVEGCFDDNSVTLSWNAPGTGTPTGYMIFAIDGGTDPAGAKTDANTYTANSDFSAATPVTPASLGRVVYKGTATTATVTGLTENNNYSFTVYSYVGETLTGWSGGGTGGSTVTNETAQGDVSNLVATPLTNQVNLNWNNPLPTSCFDQLIIVANTGTVTFTPTGTYANTDVDYSTPNSIVFSTTGTVSVNSVGGLTNGTNYCFKVFIRRGATWSEGVEVCAVPSLTYCASSGDDTDGYETGIRRVQFNTIDNTTPIEDNDYSNFTSISTTVNLGDSYDLTVSVNTDGDYTNYNRAWIDWNQNGSFNDSGEEYDLGLADDPSGTNPSVVTDNSPLSIEIPTNAAIGATRMRVASRYDNYSTSCQNGFDGEVEDYTVIVQQPSGAEINIKGNNITIANGFNAPYGLNNTLFGAQNVGSTSAFKNYFVENIGAISLSLNGTPRVDIIGAHAGDFTVTLQPAATVGSLSNSEFRIVFSPTADGTRTATVRIENTDSDEDPYEFDIQGNAVCSTVLTSNMWPTEGPENTEVTITSVNNLTGATATINGDAMTIVSSSATELVVLVPAGATSGNLEVLFSTGCSSSNTFTVIDNVINGCETAVSSTTPTDLFISEVTDATSGSSSYVEIFNGTGAAVNLDDYDLVIYNNGNASSSGTVNLTGTLANNGLHVVSIGTTTCSLNNLNVSPDQSAPSLGGVNFDTNKADAIVLEKSSGTNQGEKDVFGEKGSGTWANSVTFGDDGVNFRRKNDAPVLPTMTFDLAHWDIIDWATCGDSDYVNIGLYDFSLGIPPSVSVLNSPTFSCTTTVQLSVVGTEGVPSGFGLVYQWYYLAPNTNTFVVVPSTADFNNDSTSATLDIDNPLPYIDYQFYCQVRENTATCYTASNAVKISVVTTIWDGSDWTASTPPDEDTIAIIDGPYDTFTNGDIDACRLIINSGIGTTLNVANSGYVRVVNNVLNNGTITVQTHGAFVQDGLGLAGNGTSGTFINNGSASVIKYTELLNDWYEYTYWSSPVLNQALNDATPNTPASRRFYFETANYLDQHTDETTNGIPDDIDDNGDDWQNATGDIMELGRGYAATSSPLGLFPQTDQATFDGEFFTGDLFKSVIRNGFAGDNDWNFVGNPYASAISFTDLHAENSTIIDGAAYLWSQALPPLDTNPGNEVMNFNDADYAIITVGSGNTAGGSGVIPAAGNYIPSAQGFFVKAINAGGNLRFTNQMRRADNTSNNQFYRSSDPENDSSIYETNRLWVNLTSESGVFNQILVAYVDGATNGEDSWSYDAPRNLSSGLSSVIYTSIENVDTRYAIQGKSPSSLSIEEVIPVGFKTNITQATLYKFSIAQLEGEFMNNNTVYLKDNLMNIIHDLSANDYAFTSEIGEFNDRFEIVFQSEALSVNENELTPNDLTIVELGNGDVTFSVGKNMTIDAVEIMDMLGRTIYNLRGQNSTETYNLSNLSQATYIARVTLSNGQIITKKAVKMN
ncbi:GEVED domain-containing protein [Psychroserpens sp. AS72]|uniref:GEVED domain-containing protein n=1 Tax=Psychroserpens sp. AS72 TaxID=3135775 RepID=UPI0031719978